MKEKILAELKKKFPGLSNEFLGFLAIKLEPKATDETQIEGAIDELDKILPIKDQAAFFQSESDRRVTSAEKTLRDKYDFKEKGAPQDPPDEKQKKGADEYEKRMAAIDAKLAEIESREARQKLNDAFIKKLADEKIPLSFARGHVIEKPEDIEKAFTEASNEYAAVKQEFINQGFSQETEPVIGGQRDKDGVSTAVKTYIESKANPEKASGSAAGLGGKQL
jgi:hypothetical protein